MNSELSEIQKKLDEVLSHLYYNTKCSCCNGNIQIINKLNSLLRSFQSLFASQEEQLKEYEYIYLKDDDEIVVEIRQLKAKLSEQQKEIEKCKILLFKAGFRGGRVECFKFN